jgi:hypothetical protein
MSSKTDPLDLYRFNVYPLTATCQLMTIENHITDICRMLAEQMQYKAMETNKKEVKI